MGCDYFVEDDADYIVVEFWDYSDPKLRPDKKRLKISASFFRENKMMMDVKGAVVR